MIIGTTWIEIKFYDNFKFQKYAGHMIRHVFLYNENIFEHRWILGNLSILSNLSRYLHIHERSWSDIVCDSVQFTRFYELFILSPQQTLSTLVTKWFQQSAGTYYLYRHVKRCKIVECEEVVLNNWSDALCINQQYSVTLKPSHIIHLEVVRCHIRHFENIAWIHFVIHSDP